MPMFEGKLFTQRKKLSQKNQSLCGSLHWRFRDPGLHRFDKAAGCDEQTDGRLYNSQDALSIDVARKNSTDLRVTKFLYFLIFLLGSIPELASCLVFTYLQRRSTDGYAVLKIVNYRAEKIR